MKKKLHIHSDNAEWAGCENMPGIFLANPDINREFDVSFSFRSTKEYLDGMAKWVPDLSKDDCELCHSDVCSGVGKPKPLTPYACLRIAPVHRARLYPQDFPITKLYRIAAKSPFLKPLMALKYLTIDQEILTLYRLFKELKPDILHINNGGYPAAMSCNSAAIAGGLAKISKITYMINSTVRNLWWEKPITTLVKKYVTRFITASWKLAANSDFLHVFPKHTTAEAKEKDYWSAVKNWIVIPNTVIRRPVAISKASVRKKFDIYPSTLMFLALGKLEYRKGFHELIRAWDDLPSREVPAHLIVAGQGEMRGELQDLADNMKRGLATIYSGYSIDDYSLINACDAFVLPSLCDEDFPNVLLIAMMYGKPVIASAIGGIPELVCPDAGFKVSLENGFRKNLTAAIAKLIDQSNVKIPQGLGQELDGIKWIGHNALDCYNERYGTEKIIKRYIKLWSE